MVKIKIDAEMNVLKELTIVWIYIFLQFLFEYKIWTENIREFKNWILQSF